MLGTALGAALLTAAAGAEPVTLDQAVEEAMTRGPDQTVWAANLDASRATEAAARARAGLTLSASGGWSATKTASDPEKTTDDQVPETANAGMTLATPLTSLTVRGTQTLQWEPAATTPLTQVGSATLTQVLWNGYPGGAAQATAEKAALTLKTAELNAQANRNKLVLTVKQAYFTLLSAQESLSQLVLTQKQRQETLKFVQTKFDLGQATALDLKQAQINLKTANLDLLAAQAALEVGRRRLANLMGRGDAEALAVQPAEAPDIGVATLAEAVDRAMAQRIEPQIAQASARAAQIDALAAFGSALPSVSLSGGVTWTNDQAKETTALAGTLGVTLSAPLVDAGLAQAQGALADAQKRAAQAQYGQVLKTIPVDVAEAWNNWQVALGRLETAAGSAEVAEGQRLVVQTQFDAGLKTLSDLQTADVTLSTAQLNLLKAKITAQLSALTLQSQLGQ